MRLPSLDFESSASANFTTPAPDFVEIIVLSVPTIVKIFNLVT